MDLRSLIVENFRRGMVVEDFRRGMAVDDFRHGMVVDDFHRGMVVVGGGAVADENMRPAAMNRHSRVYYMTVACYEMVA